MKLLNRLRKRTVLVLILFLYYLTTGVFASETTEIKWLGHAGFQITTPNGGVLLIDPWLNNPMAPNEGFKIEKVDLILVTNGNFDHFGDTARIIKDTGASLVSVLEVGKIAISEKGVPKEKATFETLMNIGGKISVLDGEVEIAMVQAAHSSGIILNKAQNTIVPKKSDAKKADQEKAGSDKSEMFYGGSTVGFIITIKDGPAIYHTGDTGLFGDMRLIRQVYHPNLLMLPIGDHFTMGPELAALAVKMINPRWVIPMSYDTFPVLTGTPEKFAMEVSKVRHKAEIIVLKPGEVKKF